MMAEAYVEAILAMIAMFKIELYKQSIISVYREVLIVLIFVLNFKLCTNDDTEIKNELNCTVFVFQTVLI